jgi:Flp pilus assembly pilin Flp
MARCPHGRTGRRTGPPEEQGSDPPIPRPPVGKEGQSLTEYALMLFLVVLASVAGVSLLGTSLNGLYGRILASF